MLVRHKATKGVYAMKILKKRAIIARNQVEHTKAERKIFQALQHPFLMTLRYAFQSREKLYFVLDYYQGGELFFHLKNNRRFSEEVARLYVGEMCLVSHSAICSRFRWCIDTVVLTLICPARGAYASNQLIQIKPASHCAARRDAMLH